MIQLSFTTIEAVNEEQKCMNTICDLQWVRTEGYVSEWHKKGNEYFN